jgi:vesicle-associated membrane protein 7
MPLVYALVARGATVLAEYSASQGNFAQVAHELLGKVESGRDARLSFAADKHLFNVLVKGGTVFLCLSDQGMGRSVPFAFLDKVQRLFEEQFKARAAQRSVPYSLNADLAPLLRRQLEYFNADGSDKLSEVQEGLDRVKGVMQENISMVLERGEKLEHLVVQSESLMDSSSAFRSGATKLQSAMYWSELRTKACLGVLAAAALLLVLANACGGITFPECK